MATARGTKKKNTVQGDVFESFGKAVGALYGGKTAEAKKLLSKIEKNFPGESEVLARVRVFQKVCDRKLDKVDGKVVDTAEATFDMGVFHHNNGDFDSALKLYEKALKLSKDDAYHIHYAMAATKAQQGEDGAAIESLQKAIELHSDCRFNASNDPDFALLAGSEDFRNLVEMTGH